MAEVSAYRGESKKTAITPVTGVSKIIELEAESSKSWEDAVQICVAEAVRTVKNITSLSIDSLHAAVKDDALCSFQVRCKVRFTIDDAMRSH